IRSSSSSTFNRISSFIGFLFVVFPVFGIRTDEPTGALRFMHRRQPGNSGRMSHPAPDSSSVDARFLIPAASSPHLRAHRGLETVIRSWAGGHLTAGAFVPRIVRVVVRRVVVSRIASRARGDPLLQFFNFKQNLIL